MLEWCPGRAVPYHAGLYDGVKRPSSHPPDRAEEDGLKGTQTQIFAEHFSPLDIDLSYWQERQSSSVLRVWSFGMHALYILSTDNWDDSTELRRNRTDRRPTRGNPQKQKTLHFFMILRNNAFRERLRGNRNSGNRPERFWERFGSLRGVSERQEIRVFVVHDLLKADPRID